jgi:hypothetical protein
MLTTWCDSWFEEGARLIYIASRSAVDAILPLRIEPEPADVERVFVGRIELITADTRESVETAIRQNNWAALDRYGRFLAPILERIYARDRAPLGEVIRQFSAFERRRGAGDCR